jgi:CheY-like chemotaxis protein
VEGIVVEEHQAIETSKGGCEHGTVLIVDDDPGMREALAMLLSDEGYQVVTACNGCEAFSYLTHHEAPCLILLDMMMPVMDGYAFRMKQRQHPALTAIPIAALSAAGKSEQLTEMFPAGFLRKPVNVDALLTLVERYC